MFQALWTAGSGMIVQQLTMDVFANNMANVNTPGFKRDRVNFDDLLYTQIKTQSINGGQIGNGVKVAGMITDLTPGSLQLTGRNLDVAIQGDGYFQVKLADGTVAYTRDGSFTIDANRQLVTSQGNCIEPAIIIPEGATNIEIAKDGTLTAYLSGETTPTTLGRFSLTRFINTTALERKGNNLLVPTVNSGPAQNGLPGEAGFGTIEAGFVEMSNVNIAEEMVNVILGQRAYELSSRTIKNADDMLSIANSLLRR